ncbi:hypothetical protein [Polaribacter sp.]|uniref:hypothetical protein n=1 Tax=Polaribacter sp. TaxID=1920175 RepID=UPI003EF21FCD
MKKYLIIIILLFSKISFAHNPNASTIMLVEKENKTWVLQISSSLTAFQQEIKTHFAKTPYKTPEEFQQMVLEHVKNNLTIIFNDTQTIELSKGVVKLGHETKVVFEVIGVPLEIKKVFVKNSTFKDIHKNQSALLLLKSGFKKEHFILNNKNKHTLKLISDTNKFVLEGKNESLFSASIVSILVALIALSALYLILKKRKNNL